MPAEKGTKETEEAIRFRAPGEAQKEAPLEESTDSLEAQRISQEAATAEELNQAIEGELEQEIKDNPNLSPEQKQNWLKRGFSTVLNKVKGITKENLGWFGGNIVASTSVGYFARKAVKIGVVALGGGTGWSLAAGGAVGGLTGATRGYLSEKRAAYSLARYKEEVETKIKNLPEEEAAVQYAAVLRNMYKGNIKGDAIQIKEFEQEIHTRLGADRTDKIISMIMSGKVDEINEVDDRKFYKKFTEADLKLGVRIKNIRNAALKGAIIGVVGGAIGSAIHEWVYGSKEAAEKQLSEVLSRGKFGSYDAVVKKLSGLKKAAQAIKSTFTSTDAAAAQGVGHSLASSAAETATASAAKEAAAGHAAENATGQVQGSVGKGVLGMQKGAAGLTASMEHPVSAADAVAKEQITSLKMEKNLSHTVNKWYGELAKGKGFKLSAAEKWKLVRLSADETNVEIRGTHGFPGHHHIDPNVKGHYLDTRMLKGTDIKMTEANKYFEELAKQKGHSLASSAAETATKEAVAGHAAENATGHVEGSVGKGVLGMQKGAAGLSASMEHPVAGAVSEHQASVSVPEHPVPENPVSPVEHSSSAAVQDHLQNKPEITGNNKIAGNSTLGFFKKHPHVGEFMIGVTAVAAAGAATGYGLRKWRSKKPGQAMANGENLPDEQTVKQQIEIEGNRTEADQTGAVADGKSELFLEDDDIDGQELSESRKQYLELLKATAARRGIDINVNSYASVEYGGRLKKLVEEGLITDQDMQDVRKAIDNAFGLNDGTLERKPQELLKVMEVLAKAQEAVTNNKQQTTLNRLMGSMRNIHKETFNIARKAYNKQNKK